jgi:hypothetical protein
MFEEYKTRPMVCNNSQLGVIFKEIEGLDKATIIKFNEFDTVRLYYIKNIYEVIDFTVLRWIEGDWDDEDPLVEVICYGSIYFDGLRHIYWHPITDGYGYYFNIIDCINLMDELKKIILDNMWDTD